MWPTTAALLPQGGSVLLLYFCTLCLLQVTYNCTFKRKTFPTFSLPIPQPKSAILHLDIASWLLKCHVHCSFIKLYNIVLVGDLQYSTGVVQRNAMCRRTLELTCKQNCCSPGPGQYRQYRPALVSNHDEILGLQLRELLYIFM